MSYFEKSRRFVFLLISILSVLGVQTTGRVTYCLGEGEDSNEIGDPSFVLDNTPVITTTQCQYRVLQCKSINFCTIQWFFNGVPYDDWSLGSDSGTNYFLEDGNQTLTFTSADVDAMGNYTCVVSNGVESISRPFTLDIDEGSWLYKPTPYESTSTVCKNQTAILGGNASFFCQFRYRKSSVFLSYSWRKLNETYNGYQLVDFYDIPVTRFNIEHRIEEDSSFQTSEICPEVTPPKILSTWLNITNVTEEALGKYLVTCQISQYITKIHLTLSLEISDQPITRVADKRIIVGLLAAMVILLLLSVLSWKRYGSDVKLWYHDRHQKLETEEMDGKLYDAYIVSCYHGEDRAFVDNVLNPTLQDRYKLFIRERDATFGFVESEEILEVLSKSRRCIVIMSADFYRPSPTTSPTNIPSSSSSSSTVEITDHGLTGTEWHLFELQHALDSMPADAIIPLLYRDSGPTTSSSNKDDSNAKLVDHVINDLRCIEWKQRNKTCLNEWALKRLRLRLPPRRRSNTPSIHGQSFSATRSVTPAITPSNISSSISLTSRRSLPSERPDVDYSNRQQSSSTSGPISSEFVVDVIEEGAMSSNHKRPSQSSSHISFMSTSISPLSLSPSKSLSSSYGSGSMSTTLSQCLSFQQPPSPNTSSINHSPSNYSTDHVITQAIDNLNSFQQYEPNSNRLNTSLSVFQFFPGRKKGPYLMDNESQPVSI